MQPENWITGEISLAVGNQQLRLNISVPAEPVNPQAMLPVFQKLANAFTDLSVNEVEAEGKTISCQKGCGACCRQPIPLMEVEISHINSVVEALPEPRRAIIKSRFAEAAGHFKANGWLQRFEALTEESELKAANRAYFFEGVACPFLEDESCSIYLQRPVACREFMVTSPAVACMTDEQDEIRKMPMAISALTGLRNFAATGRLEPKGFLPMIFAPEWEAAHPENVSEKTGPEWLAEFFG